MPDVKVYTYLESYNLMQERAKKLGYRNVRLLVVALHKGTASREAASMAFMIDCNPDYGMGCSCHCSKAIKDHYYVSKKR